MLFAVQDALLGGYCQRPEIAGVDTTEELLRPDTSRIGRDFLVFCIRTNALALGDRFRLHRFY